MNTVELIIDSDKFFAELDSEFDIVVTNDTTIPLAAGELSVKITDSRKVAKMRAEIQKIYKDNVANCKQ